MSQSQLTSFDQKLLESAELYITPSAGKRYKIDFQFPPKIISESNSATWKPDNVMGAQPINIHEGSSGRAMIVEWEYIATDNVFTPKNIAKMLQMLKSYFFEFDFGKVGSWMPVIIFNYSGVMSGNPSFRVINTSITYGPEMIAQDGVFFPLHSIVNISMELATQGAGKGGTPATQSFARNLRREPKPEWY